MTEYNIYEAPIPGSDESIFITVNFAIDIPSELKGRVTKETLQLTLAKAAWDTIANIKEP